MDNVNVRFNALMSAQSFSLPLNAWASDVRALGMASHAPLGPRQGA